MACITGLLSRPISAAAGLSLELASIAAARALFMGLGDLDGGVQDSRAFGVSADGSAVVGVGNSGEVFPQTSHDEAFRWTLDTGMVGLGDLPGSEFFSSGAGVSGDCKVVVAVSNSSSDANPFQTEAFNWSEETGMVGLGDLPSIRFESWGFGANSDGSALTGWSLSDLGFERFR